MGGAMNNRAVAVFTCMLVLFNFLTGAKCFADTSDNKFVISVGSTFEIDNNTTATKKYYNDEWSYQSGNGGLDVLNSESIMCYKFDISSLNTMGIYKVYLKMCYNKINNEGTLKVYSITDGWVDSIIDDNLTDNSFRDLVISSTYAQETYDKPTTAGSNTWSNVDITPLLQNALISNKKTLQLYLTYSSGSGPTTGAAGLRICSIVNKSNMPYIEIEYYRPPAAQINKISGFPIVGQTINVDYKYTSPNNITEGNSLFSWLECETAEGVYTPIEGANGNSLILSENQAGKYIKCSVTPVANDPSAPIGASVISDYFGYIYSVQQVANVIDEINKETVTSNMLEIIKKHNTILNIDYNMPLLSHEGKENVLTMCINDNFVDYADFIKKFTAFVKLQQLNEAQQENAREVLENPDLGLNLTGYNRLDNTNKEIVVSAFFNKGYTSLDGFYDEFNKYVCLIEFKNVTRQNVKPLLIYYDSIFTADISALDDYTAGLAGIALIDKTFNNYDELDSAVASCVSAAKKQVEDEKENPPSQPKKQKSKSKGSGVTVPSGSVMVQQPIIGAAQIESTPKKDNISEGVNYFTDLADASWAQDAINQLAKKGIVAGESNGVFNPNGAVSREQFAKILLSALSITDGDDVDFIDVSKDEWYYKYVCYAKSSGIINGISQSEFGIGTKISREDMAAMLYRALEFKGAKFNENDYIIFNDNDQIAEYAYKEAARLAYVGIINGMDEGNFEPKTVVTRAMAAVVVSNAMKYLGIK